MNTIMNDNHIKTLAQVRPFLEGTQTVEFSLQTKTERYDFIRCTLIRSLLDILHGPTFSLMTSIP